jgi:hypothetical protein
VEEVGEEGNRVGGGGAGRIGRGEKSFDGRRLLYEVDVAGRRRGEENWRWVDFQKIPCTRTSCMERTTTQTLCLSLTVQSTKGFESRLGRLPQRSLPRTDVHTQPNRPAVFSFVYQKRASRLESSLSWHTTLSIVIAWRVDGQSASDPAGVRFPASLLALPGGFKRGSLHAAFHFLFLLLCERRHGNPSPCATASSMQENLQPSPQCRVGHSSIRPTEPTTPR